MTTNPTPVLRLSRPPFNSSTWHDDMHNNATIIDGAMASIGILTNIKGVWANSTFYDVEDRVASTSGLGLWANQVAHTSPATGSFIDYLTANPGSWRPVTGGIVPRGAWATATEYKLNDVAFEPDMGMALIAVADHTSGDLAADVLAGLWFVIIDFSALADTAHNVEDSVAGAEAAAVAAAASAVAAEAAAVSTAEDVVTVGVSASEAAASAAAALVSADDAVNGAQAAAISESAAQVAETGAVDARIAAENAQIAAELAAASIDNTKVVSRTFAGTADTLVLTDAGKAIRSTGADTAEITVPPNSEVAFPIDTRIDLEQYGAGQLWVIAGVGVTIQSKEFMIALATQYSGATLHKIAEDEWMLIGDLA